MIERIGVAGAGTMGAGIAQLACLAGHRTRLYDPRPPALEQGLERLRDDLARGAERGRWSESEADAAAARVLPAAGLEQLADCELVIEAAPESLELKQALFRGLEAACGDDGVLATNTSSLSVTAIAAAADRPERVCGMHFFNPPALMELVEIVAGEATAPATLAVANEVAERMGRTAIRCADSPGFVVNRCNRPFALESLRMLDEEVASHRQIDRVVREDGGYRMGPFELIDLIGVDVNLSVARSFYEQRPEPRWQPHPIQERLVAEGRLGRKSGAGFYEYDEDGAKLGDDPEVAAALRRRVLERLVSQLVNEACYAVGEGVATAADVDRAMRLGLNHPRGTFEWGRELGPRRALAVLEALGDELGPERYLPAPLLSRWSVVGGDAPPS